MPFTRGNRVSKKADFKGFKGLFIRGAWQLGTGKMKPDP